MDFDVKMAEEYSMTSFHFSEFLAEHTDGWEPPQLQRKALLHGHCHQKAFGAMPAVEQVLKLVPGLAVRTVESSCCGMAGSFGYA